ncbi:MAG: SRPBCC family protein, partial [Geodermatophilaceae bacterium]
MADQSQQSIDIAASAADIMSVIGDFEAYPEWTGAVKTAEVLEEDEEGWAKQVHFVLDAGVVKDDYVLA